MQISSIMWHQHILIMPHPSATIWHPPTYKSAFEGALGSGTKHQGVWGEFLPLVYQIMCKWILVPAVAHELAPNLFNHGLVGPGKHWQTVTAWMRETFAEVQVSYGDVLAHHWSERYELECNGEVCKDWKRWLLFQMQRQQCQTSRNLKNQGHMAPSKDYSDLVTNSNSGDLWFTWKRIQNSCFKSWFWER